MPEISRPQTGSTTCRPLVVAFVSTAMAATLSASDGVLSLIISDFSQTQEIATLTGERHERNLPAVVQFLGTVTG